MAEHTTPELDPVTAVARDLRAIVEMHADLEEQAVHKATERDMPGGDAMVMLGPVANLEAWQNKVDRDLADWLERGGWARRQAGRHDDDEPFIDTDDDWEPPLMTLLFWSEQWRVEHNRESDRRPTIGSEAKFLGQLLGWAHATQVHWIDFATDVRKARARIEATLMEGYRQGRAATCQCGGVLVREVTERSPRRRCPGHGPYPTCPWPRQGCDDRGGLEDERRCSRCGKVYGVTEYLEHVARDYRDNATTLSGVDLEKRTGVSVATIRVWANRGKVHKGGRDAYGRQLYSVADVVQRARDAVDVGISADWA